MQFIFTLTFLLICHNTFAKLEQSTNVKGVVDLHTHLAAHILEYGYGKGPLQNIKKAKSLTHRHSTKQTMYESYIEKSDLKIIVTAALGNVLKMDLPGYRPHNDIEEQIGFVEEFVAKFPLKYAIATDPAQARIAISRGKIVFVHAIEGATKLIKTVDDVEYWKKRGVVLITPIHLRDNQIGGAYLSNRVYPFINPTGRFLKGIGRYRGLKKIGKKVIEAMVDSGMLIDLSHMGEDSRKDTLDILAKRGVGPIVTHGYTKEILDDPRNFSNDEIDKIYNLGGLFGIGGDIKALSKTKKIYKKSSDHCPRTIDSFLIQYDHIRSLRSKHNRAIAFGSDFNGGANNFRPRYGKRGCFDKDRPIISSDFETSGLRHIGMMKGFINDIEKRSESKTINHSAEAFLRAWEIAEKVSKKTIF